MAKVTLSLSSHKDSDPIHEGSIFTSNNHPKAPPPNPITLQHVNFEEDPNIQSTITSNRKPRKGALIFQAIKDEG